MPLYEVIVTGTIQGDQAIWRSNWERTTDPVGGNLFAYRLLQAIGFDEADTTAPQPDSLLEYFQACATGQAVITSLFSRNLYDDLDFSEIPLGAGWIGLQSGGAYAPPFVNAQWRSNRTNLAVRRGHVSTWGIQEANIDDSSNVIGSDLTGPMDEFAGAMSIEQTHTIVSQLYGFRSCVLSKERYMVAGTGTDPITNPARWAYKYYDTEAEQLEHAALDLTWERMLPVSSRMSRKKGRGA